MSMKINMNLSTGDRLRMARRSKGLTQSQLSEKTGISRASIMRYENNERESPFSKMEEIAKALGVDVNDLMPDSYRISPATFFKILDASDAGEADEFIQELLHHIQKIMTERDTGQIHELAENNAEEIEELLKQRKKHMEQVKEILIENGFDVKASFPYGYNWRIIIVIDGETLQIDAEGAEHILNGFIEAERIKTLVKESVKVVSTPINSKTQEEYERQIHGINSKLGAVYASLENDTEKD